MHDNGSQVWNQGGVEGFALDGVPLFKGGWAGCLKADGGAAKTMVLNMRWLGVHFTAQVRAKALLESLQMAD